ncbi:unnamed protein product [Caenorhabditis bovis]|uniref:G-protein coupled receptors family 1 profile domain-containing protein n=1 Tax=Caenorhabditis bovis TaxID=2654633 RepID=A0A8S1EZ21_9PELO|nr:unnamed protein product [Caenorhabditis bovis]
MPWSMYVFFAMSIIAIPLYLLIFICLCGLRTHSKIYNSTFYTLFMQHCIADFLAILTYYFVNPIRQIPAVQKFYFEYQKYYIAAACFNTIYVCFIIRCCGIILLSLQRFVIIVFPTSHISLAIQNASKLKVILVFWLIPLPLSIFILKDADFYYDSLETMQIIAPLQITNRNSIIALSIVSLACAICSMCHLSIYIAIRQKVVSKRLRRELNLTLQIVALHLAFFVMMVFYGLVNHFGRTGNSSARFYIRTIYPIANGFLSYLNPFCVLLLNRDLGERVKCLITRRTIRTSDIQLSMTTQSTKLRNHQ